MKKIMHIVFSLAPGGLENMVVDIANSQSKKHDVCIVVINNVVDNGILKRINSIIKLIMLSRKPASKSPFPLLQLYKIYLQFKPDLIHIHNQKTLKFFPKTIFGTKQSIIYTEHATGTVFGKEATNATKFCAISHAVKQDLWNRQTIKSQVIYNGIPISEIPCRNHWQVPKNEYRLLQISRLMHNKKGQDLLLEAIARLKVEQPELLVKLDFIGDGESRDYLKSIVNKLSLNEQVRFLGSLPKDAVYRQLKTYDILVQPSRYEGFGLTIAEAMAAKVPVITSDIEGPLEVIDYGRCGQIFTSGDNLSLAQAILFTVDLYQTGKIQEQVEVARKRVCQLFDIENTAMLYAAL